MSHISQVMEAKTVNSARQRSEMSRMGFWAAILTALAAAAALGIAVTTAPPRSGPNCWFDSCITYPFTDAAAFVPTDYFWMIPAFLMGPLFVVLVVCARHFASPGKQGFGQIALAFAVIAAAALTINYYIQLSVVQPSLLKGELEGLTLFSQYNPHGVFIALEDLGYLMMGAAFLFTAALFGRRERLERVIRLTLTSGGILAIGSFLLLSLRYGSDLGYNYEVIAILIDWSILIVSGALMSFFFLRR